MILIASYSGVLGGAERLLVNLAQHTGDDCVLACPEGELARSARERGLFVFPLPERTLAFRNQPVRAAARLLSHAAELRRLVRSIQPDLLLAWSMRSAISSLVPARVRVPVVFVANDLLPGAVVGAVVRLATRRAQLTVGSSRAVIDDLDPDGRLGLRCVVVHPGVDVGRYPASSAPLQPPEVLVLGALSRRKHPELALEVCALARRKLPELRLRLVGAAIAVDGDPASFGDVPVASLRARATHPDLNGSVEFVGAVADPRDALLRASCVLHCAEREAFGLALIEALAAARPVVAPAAGGPAEIIDGSCGVLYEPGDAVAAADALVRLLSEPARVLRMGAAGRVRAEREFGLPAARERFRTAIRSVHRPALDGGAGAMPGLAIVTVTRNSEAVLASLLSSVRRWLGDARVVVVDCASQDRTVELARGSPTVAEVIALEQNVGFARACNLGVRTVSEPVVALLNPDVELLDGSLARLAQEAVRSEQPERLLAPLVLDPDGSRQDSVHPRPLSLPALASTVIPPAAVPRRLRTALAPWNASSPRPVGWAVGCALVARTETLLRLGPFDERFFLYGEDLDLGLRAAASGTLTWFWPSTRVIHRRAHASRQEFGGEPYELLARARHDALSRRLGPGRARLDDAAQELTFVSRIALRRLLGRDPWRQRRQREAVRRTRRRG